MPNQPAKDGSTILIRLPQAKKNEIQAQVDRLNTENPGAGYTMSSWIRAVVDAELIKVKKAAAKKNK